MTKLINLSKLALLAISSALLGCGTPAGSPCEITGSGFHARHNCSEKCLQYTQITCPSGEVTAPQLCSGKSGCEPGDCPDGQACYHLNDPFEKRSYCVPTTVCADLSSTNLEQWEQQAKSRAAETRRKRDAKFGGRNKTPAATTEPASE